MTAFDVLNLYQTPFEWMLNSGIHIEDVSYVGLYKEYIRMKKDGCKTTYIVVYLAEKYRISFECEIMDYTTMELASHADMKDREMKISNGDLPEKTEDEEPLYHL